MTYRESWGTIAMPMAAHSRARDQRVEEEPVSRSVVLASVIITGDDHRCEKR